MKKDLFNNNIKREFVSYIWTSIILALSILVIVGCLCVWVAFEGSQPTSGKAFFATFGVVFILFGIIFTYCSLLVIRKYPKYPKLRKLCFNSDYYFVGSDSKEFRGTRRSKHAFNAAVAIANQNKDLGDIKYPQKYHTYKVLTIVGIVVMFLLIFIFKCIYDAGIFKSENIFLTVFVLVEAMVVILNFVCAFRISKIRKNTIEQYRKNAVANHK